MVLHTRADTGNNGLQSIRMNMIVSLTLMQVDNRPAPKKHGGINAVEHAGWGI